MKFIKLLILVFLLVFISCFIYLNLYLARVSATPPFYFLKTGLNVLTAPTLTNSVTFLILGLDPRHDVLENTVTTDTIIAAKYANGQLNLVSLPRDLWIDRIESKINQIYPLALKQPDPFIYINQQFYQITGQLFDRIIIINTADLSRLVTAVGGITVNLTEGFTDDQYPNPEYIKNPFSGVDKNITVEFPPGQNQLDAANIEYFVRSRKSATGGTDLGRIRRQQLVIDAILTKLKSPQFYRDPQKVLAVYRIWTEMDTNFTDADIASLFRHQYSQIKSLTTQKHEITSSIYDKTGLIYHPLYFKNNQWVFIPRDPTFRELHQFINRSFNLN